MTTTGTHPLPDEYFESFGKYVGMVPEAGIVAVLEAQLATVRAFADGLPKDKETFAYAPRKWTVREVLGHVNDGERVFGFRAFTFSRSTAEALPGFDENEYIERASYGEVPIATLAEEFAALRTANLCVLRGLRDDQWMAKGIANQKPITVRAIAFVMAGHVRHHLEILKSRYGVSSIV